MDGDRRRGAGRDGRFKRGQIAGREVDVGEGELLIGPVEDGKDIGGGGFFRLGWNDVFRGGLTGRPDDDLRHRDGLGQSDGVEKVGLDERLRARLDLIHGARKRPGLFGAAPGSRRGGMRLRVGNAWGCLRL